MPSDLYVVRLRWTLASVPQCMRVYARVNLCAANEVYNVEDGKQNVRSIVRVHSKDESVPTFQSHLLANLLPLVIIYIIDQCQNTLIPINCLFRYDNQYHI